LYKTPHTKIAQFLKPRYKCHIFTPWTQSWIY